MKRISLWLRERHRGIFSAAMLGVSLLFYLFFAFRDGAVICVDSPGYISMDIHREPLYCMFLAGLRMLFSAFPENFYLDVAALLQSLLAAFAAWSLVNTLWKEFHLSRTFAFFLLCVPLAVSLLCRFAAARQSMYSNSILTEGLTISLYMLFFCSLLKYFHSGLKKNLLFCCLLSFLLVSIRKQMLVSLILLTVCIMAAHIRKREFFRGLGWAAACAALVLGGSTALDLGYNYVVRGEAVRHSSDVRFLTTMAFYTAERSDADYIEDGQLRELFLEIYDACEEGGYLKHSAGKGWLNRVTHFGDYYDCIQIDTMWPAVNAFVQENYGDGTVFLSEHADQIMRIFNRSLIPHNLGKILGSFLDNFLSGLITTVAQRNRILNWYSLLAYLLYLILFLWAWKEWRRGKARGRIVETAGLTLLSVFCNVGVVSLVIFCQTRYTIYNMALFYVSLGLLVHTFYMAQRQKIKKTQNFHNLNKYRKQISDKI